MNSEKFCLRWNDFENNISEAFKELRELNDFFDVTLVCGDEQLQAHKLILSACSPFFGNILRRNPHHHPLLYLKGVRYTDLQSVLNFMYHGEVSVAQEELNSFLAVAEDLRVKGLTQNNQNNENLPKKSSISEPKIVNKDKPTIKLCNKEMKAKASLVKSSFESSCSYIDKEEVQQVSLIKTEPTDFPPPNPPMHLQHSSYGQQASYSITTEEENTAVYTDESYGEYEQYGEEQGYPMAENGNADAGTNKGCIVENPSDLIQFIRKDPADQKFYCTLCTNFSHKVITCARNHVESKHYPNVFTYSCDQCDQTFSTKTNLNAHRTRKHKQLKIQQQQFYMD